MLCISVLTSKTILFMRRWQRYKDTHTPRALGNAQILKTWMF